MSDIRLLFKCFALCGLLIGISARAQYHYLIENTETGSVVRRGAVDGRGIPQGDLILAPNTAYREWMLEDATLRVGVKAFITPAAGQGFAIPMITFRLPVTPDRDGDGLHDEAEFILGTNPLDPDTDGDGLDDGSEFTQGLNPLDGLVAQTGVVAGVDTSGQARHLIAFDDVAVVAERGRGIVVFNIFNTMSPVIVSQVSTPGQALAAHFSGRYVAVADGDAGLAVIDMLDPPAATVIHQISQTVLGGAARAVTTTAGIAYVGLSNGRIAKVDLAGGTLLDRITIMGELQDVALGDDHLYVLMRGVLHSVDLDQFRAVGQTASPGNLGAGGRRLRLFAAAEVLYATHTSGYNTFSLNDPAAPQLIAHGVTAQQGWKRIVTNGDGVGVAAVSPNSTDDGPHHISIYDTGDPTQTGLFQTTFDTPGLAADVVLYNGLAYVADSEAGLQVVNYLPFDTAGNPPTITLRTSWGTSGAEEGKLVRVTADVGDDVQVRNVEFYLDGVKQATDGNFPFDYRFTTPRREGRTDFTIQARASDTGGNVTWTPNLTVPLVADGTPPRVIGVSPTNGAALGNIAVAAVFFSEPIDQTTLTTNTFSLVEAGVDGRFDTGDDLIQSGVISWRDDLLGAFLAFDSGLGTGFYRASVAGVVTDLAGNQLFEPAVWTFRVYDVGADRDGDGVPDQLESVLGLDPDHPDSDGDGIFDGDEDFDNDGLSNLVEVLIGTDPANPDSDGDGVADRDEDSDGDGLLDVDELLTYGTDPADADSDDDGFGDGDEVQDGSNPLESSSLPPSLFTNLVLPISVRNDAGRTGLLMSVKNMGNRTPNRAEMLTTILNRIAPGLTEGRITAPMPSVDSQSQPDLDTGKAVSPKTSVENQ